MLELLADRGPAIETHLRTLGWIEPNEQVVGLASAGAGNMNRTLRVDFGGRTIILKQSVPFVAAYPEIAAPTDRIDVEAAFYRVTEATDCASHMPRIQGYDTAARLLALEDLGAAADFTDVYDASDTSVASVASAGLDSQLPDLLTWLSRLHEVPVPASDLGLFDNRSMRELNHAHIFEIPFAPDNGLDLDATTPGLTELAHSVCQRPAALQRIAELAELYLAPASADSVLLHGDYYPGSWLRHPDGAKIIDPEFAFIGCREFDLGVLTAHLVFANPVAEGFADVLPLYDGNADRALVRRYAAVEVLRRLLGVAQLPLHAPLALKTAWVERALTTLEAA